MDYDSDGSVDQTITTDVNGWTVNNNGAELKIELEGDEYTAEEGDSVIVIFAGVNNPYTPDIYDIEVETSGDGNTHQGTLKII